MQLEARFVTNVSTGKPKTLQRKAQPTAIGENDRSHGLRNGEREMQTWPFGGQLRKCATARPRSPAWSPRQTRMTVTVSLSEFRCGNACDTAMPAWTWRGVTQQGTVDRT
ncbi:hypothetical protein QLX08_006536 [Tetragonisca angustula]|uniref:Uncharacterized protein n=1 Tax=Tetragonisca angustula TaxID=166442 RepID=A0AAW0ZTP5_9HYME